MRYIAIVLTALLAGCATTSTPPAALQSVRRTCQQWVAEGKVKSIAFAVSRDGRVVWEEAFGDQDAEAHVPATVDTMYTLASTGKSITGTTVLDLAREKKIDLDAPLTQRLAPGTLTIYEGDPSQVTARAMLRMGVAIPHLWWHHWTDEANTRLSSAELMHRYAIVVAPPDTAFHYSNLTFGLLAEAAGEAAHADFGRVVAQRIFEPLGMTHSSLRPDPKFAPWLAAAYGSDGKRRPYAYSDPEGGAGYRGSIHDLIRYATAHLGYDRHFRYLRQMHDGTDDYFAGWGHLLDAGGLRFAIANGAIVGSASEIKLIPADNLAVACLSNTTGADVGTIVDAVIAALEPRYQRKIATPLPQAQPWVVKPAEIGRWTGEIRTWNASIPVRLDIDQAGAMQMTIGDRTETLREVRIDSGFLRGECACTVPMSDANGEPTKADFALRHDGDRWFGSVRVISTAPRSDFSLPAYVALRRDEGDANVTRLTPAVRQRAQGDAELAADRPQPPALNF
jgi:CubicO group peptidase (beta-lactamase class C family)